MRPMAKVLKILPMVLVAGGAWASEPMALAPNAFPATEIAWVTLGRDLFYDPILSGNQNIACATCHRYWPNWTCAAATFTREPLKSAWGH